MASNLHVFCKQDVFIEPKTTKLKHQQHLITLTLSVLGVFPETTTWIPGSF